MKCYYHPQKDAVGICKTCNRGICSDCLAQDCNSIACKDHCEQVKELDNFIETNKTIHEKIGAVYALNAFIYLVSGMILLIAGFTFRNLLGIYIMIPLGTVFMISAYLQYRLAKKFIKK
ncbi:MAG: hypothetical protein ACTSVV_02285 [Promethearchaeota archaeon]